MKTQYIAKLIEKVLLSSRSDTYLLRLELSQWQRFTYAPGQFISVVLASDYPPDHPRAGMPHFENKAYTLASHGPEHVLELVLNRAGSFSSRLLDRRRW